MECPDCGYVPGRGDGSWCPWCEAPIGRGACAGVTFWGGLALVVLTVLAWHLRGGL